MRRGRCAGIRSALTSMLMMAVGFGSTPARSRTLPPPRSAADSAWRALTQDDPRADLHRVRAPALVLWGAHDNQLPLEDAFELARRLHAPVRVIAECGHLLIVERPDACLDAIETWLE